MYFEDKDIPKHTHINFEGHLECNIRPEKNGNYIQFFSLPKDHHILFLDLLMYGYPRPEKIKDQRIDNFKFLNGIPQKSKMFVSELVVYSNFSKFCTDDVI